MDRFVDRGTVLDRARPGIGERLAPLLGLPAPSSFQGLVTALINDLAGEQALLVLDDYHLIGSKGIELCRQLNWKTQPLAAGLVTLAWVRQANGDPDGAREAIAEADRVAPSPSLASLFHPVPAQRARLLLAQGDIEAAARWAQEGGLRTDDEPMYQTEREHLVLARVLLAQHQPAEALALLP